VTYHLKRLNYFLFAAFFFAGFFLATFFFATFFFATFFFAAFFFAGFFLATFFFATFFFAAFFFTTFFFAGFLAAFFFFFPPLTIFAHEMSPCLSMKYRNPDSFLTPTLATFLGAPPFLLPASTPSKLPQTLRLKKSH